MKGQIWNCKEIKWRAESNNQTIKNCLVVFTCFESGDTPKIVFEAVKRINKLNSRRFKRNNLVIFPFVHLSSKVLAGGRALKFFKILSRKLKTDFEKLEMLPFNQEKEVILHLGPKTNDVSYFEY